MSDWDLWRIVIASAGLIAILIFVLLKGTESKIKGLNTKILARSGVFAAISIILYIIPFFNFNIPFFPPFPLFPPPDGYDPGQLPDLSPSPACTA